MAASIVSSIIFFLLFIILSLFVDGKVFAAQMKHRKLGGAKETMTMRRYLEENGHQNSKIDTKRKAPQHSGQKNSQYKPDTRPNQATAHRNYISYKTLKNSNCTVYTRCKLSVLAPEPSLPPSSSKDTHGH